MKIFYVFVAVSLYLFFTCSKLFLERYTYTKFSTSGFFHQKCPFGPLIYIHFSSNINSNSPRYLNFMVILLILSMCGIEFFVMLEQYKKLFPFGLRSNGSPSFHFWSDAPLKAVNKKVLFRIFELFGCSRRILIFNVLYADKYTDNTINYIKPIQIICRMSAWFLENLTIAHKTQDEIVRILIILGMKFNL